MHFRCFFIFCADSGPICDKYLLNSTGIVALSLACLPSIVKMSGYHLVASFFVNISLIFTKFPLLLLSFLCFKKMIKNLVRRINIYMYICVNQFCKSNTFENQDQFF